MINPNKAFTVEILSIRAGDKYETIYGFRFMIPYLITLAREKLTATKP
jgi:hypothetical protein